eukprot:scaffold38001_cov184-Skeletonema_marinoi.AAC.7
MPVLQCSASASGRTKVEGESCLARRCGDPEIQNCPELVLNGSLSRGHPPSNRPNDHFAPDSRKMIELPSQHAPALAAPSSQLHRYDRPERRAHFANSDVRKEKGKNF